MITVVPLRLVLEADTIAAAAAILLLRHHMPSPIMRAMKTIPRESPMMPPVDIEPVYVVVVVDLYPTVPL